MVVQWALGTDPDTISDVFRRGAENGSTCKVLVKELISKSVAVDESVGN
jgi:hypothetical protein